jgi:hypothetical protein
MKMKTFREEAADSKVIIYGVMDNPRDGPNGASTDCIIASVIKAHPILRGKKWLILPRKVEVEDRNRPPRFLIFCDVEKGKIDAYRGIPVSPAVVDYLKGLLAINPANPVARLRYCFDFLDHPDEQIANDAVNEFQKASDREVSLAARKLPAAKLRRWLREPKTPTWRQGLFAVLLGHCGTAADADLLHKLTDRFMKEELSGMDDALKGYVLLKPKDGWLYLCKLLTNADNGFRQRYAALRTIRYLHDTRPDVIDQQSIIEAMKLALGPADLADLVIDNLRQWRCWDLTSRILPLFGKRSHDLPIIRRAILRYASDCPRPEAAEFITRHPRGNAELETLIQ